jgi:hypothetical protein
VRLYPGPTAPGRVRMTLNQDVMFYKDFTLGMCFYHSYDNSPVVGAPSNPLGGIVHARLVLPMRAMRVKSYCSEASSALAGATSGLPPTNICS